MFLILNKTISSSLGVHISFVRSIAMDSWTDKQLALMKTGGNQKCNDYLQSKGIAPRTPIKAKYESDAAQLYKEILKAKVEGRPEPTSLPQKTPRAAAPSSNGSGNMNAFGGGGQAAAAGGSDPNGMERLMGETDQQYIARQTRLREEARARMAAKFGNSGGRMGGVGSGSMGGVGSNPNYNPNSGGYGGAPDFDNVIGSVTSVFSSGLSMVSSVVNDEQTRAAVGSSVSSISNSVTSYGGSFWGALKSTVSDVATSIAQPDEDDGLAALQREFQANKPAQSKYSGFGSATAAGSSMGGMGASGFGTPTAGGFGGFQQQPSTMNVDSGMMGDASISGGLQEAPGLPGEDRNGMERLTGESDEQYVVRQTRLRDEAKARMAAKFGGGGLSSASSSATPTPSRPAPAPSSGNAFGGMNAMPAAPASYPTGMSLTSGRPSPPSAPSSGGFAPTRGVTAPRTNSKDKLDSEDFFSSFGT
jgi:ADP-ribosylation factor GTPase-activating protein 1